MKVFGRVLAFVLIGTLIPMSGWSSNAELPPSSMDSSPSPKKNQVTVDEILWWLPEDTESVAVNQNFPPPDQKPNLQVSIKSGIAEVGLGGVRRGKFAEQLAQIPLSRIVNSSRKFRDTRGFGLMPYEGCTIINLQSDLPEVHALSKWLTKNANRTEVVAGYKTFIFDEKLEQDQWHFLIVQVRSNLLLYATDKNFLESVLRRRLRNKDERAKTSRAVPANLAEWRYVNTKSSEWALRHFRKDQARLDPTSPFNKHASLPDNSAVGLTYSLDETESIAIVHYLSAPQNVRHMAKFYKEFWADLMGHMNVPKQIKWQPSIKSLSK